MPDISKLATKAQVLTVAQRAAAAIAPALTKVSGATAGNVAIFNSDGTIADSTVAIATDEEFNTALNAIFPVSGGGE